MDWLSQQPPPSKRAKPGYYPDPLRTGRSRYWDGSAWTLMMGPKVTAEEPLSKQVPTPTKVCRGCGTQTETYETNCPNCGRSYGRMSTGALIALIVGGVLAMVVFLGGCAALIVVGVNEAEDEIDETSITRQQFGSIQLGSTRAAVEDELGRPWDREQYDRPAGPLSCLYYNDVKASVFDDRSEYEFCFLDGLLVSKRPYESASDSSYD
jgi:hypothetical protein